MFLPLNFMPSLLRTPPVSSPSPSLALADECGVVRRGGGRENFPLTPIPHIPPFLRSLILHLFLSSSSSSSHALTRERNSSLPPRSRPVPGRRRRRRRRDMMMINLTSFPLIPFIPPLIQASLHYERKREWGRGRENEKKRFRLDRSKGFFSSSGSSSSPPQREAKSYSHQRPSTRFMVISLIINLCGGLRERGGEEDGLGGTPQEEGGRRGIRRGPRGSPRVFAQGEMFLHERRCVRGQFRRNRLRFSRAAWGERVVSIS